MMKTLWGLSCLVILLAVSSLAFYGLIRVGGGRPDWPLLNDPYFYRILSFSLQQALFSTLLACMGGWLMARALYYLPQTSFISQRLRRFFLALCLLCFVLPTLVLITGLVALLGHSGWLTPWLGEHWNLYGLRGILLAHVFLNMPFVVRVLYLQLCHIPDSSWQLALQLKLSPWQRWYRVEWPVMRGALWGVGGFVFILCFNSFAVVLALGGGPQSTTLEVAIYQSLKYNFNIPETLVLAWTQLLIAGGWFLLMIRLGSVHWLSIETHQQGWIPRPGWFMCMVHRCIYGFFLIFLLAPLLALLPSLLSSQAHHWANLSLLEPLLTTLLLGFLCATAGVLLSYSLLWPLRTSRLKQAYKRLWLLEWLSQHALIMPAMILSVGIYIFLLTDSDLEQWGMVWVFILNTVIVVPFALQQLRPRLYQFDDQYDALCRSLKLSHWQRLRIEWPWMRQPLQAAFTLILLLVMGDVAIFSILGADHWITLPWLIYNYASTYRMTEASLAALVLLSVCALLVWFLEKRQHA